MTHLTNNLITVAKPEITFDEVEVPFYNSKRYLNGRHTWSEISLQLRDDYQGKTAEALQRQQIFQYDTRKQSGTRAGGGYKFTTLIDDLDGDSEGAKTISRWCCYGCLITRLKHSDVQYTASEVMTIDVGIRIDAAVYVTPTMPGEGRYEKVDGDVSIQCRVHRRLTMHLRRHK